MDITRLLILILTCYFPYGVSPTKFSVMNMCPFTIMPGVLTINGTADTTGFTLEAQGQFTVTVSNPWNGRFWSRYGCSNETGKMVCTIGDCGTGEVSCNGKGWTPPATVLDFSVGFPNDPDIYDISLLDGFNLPVSINPIGETSCSKMDCRENINLACPTDLYMKDPTSNVTVGCKSACVAFNKPEYCCTGDYDSPDKCLPNNYSEFFKRRCPMAYSYPFDDDSLTFVCENAQEYGIVFCPS